MKKKKDIDDLIKQTLSKEDAEFYNNLDEPSILEAFNDLFKGKNKRLSISLLIFSVTLLIITIFTLVKFLNAETTEYLIKWGVATLASFFVLAFLDFYYFIQINKDITLREVKKLELQITLLANKLT